MVSPLFPAKLRGWTILLALYVPLYSLPFLQGFDTKFTTVVARIHAEGVVFCLRCMTALFNTTADFLRNLQKISELRLAEQALSAR